MRGLHRGHTFGRGEQAKEDDVGGARLFQQINRRDRGVAGGEHRVHSDHQTIIQPFGHLEVILHRLQCLFVAIQTNETDPGRGDQLQHPVHQPVARPQDRDQRKLLAVERWRVHLLHRGLDPFGRHRQAARHLIGQKLADLAQQLPESGGRSGFVAHDGQLVLHQRVVNDGQMIGGIGHAAGSFICLASSRTSAPLASKGCAARLAPLPPDARQRGPRHR